MNDHALQADSGISRRSYNVGKYDMQIENDIFHCRIFWSRVVGSETESLLTQYTKHTFYEIQYALEGRIIMQIGEKDKICIEESEFIVIPPDTYHQIVDGDNEGARFIMAFSLTIKDPGVQQLYTHLSDPVAHQETPYMRSLVEIMVKRNYHDEAVRRRLVASYLECFVLEFISAIYPSRIYGAEGQRKLNENEHRVRQIDRYVAEHHGIGVNPDNIAQHFGISLRHLNRIFVAATGGTLKENINRHKLQKIEELVTSTVLSFREISALCGFSDEYAMNKFFKRYTRFSLSEYRSLREMK